MPDDANLRALLTATIHRLMAELALGDAPWRSETVAVQDERIEVYLSVVPRTRPVPIPQPPLASAPTVGVSPSERRILSACTAEPHPVEWLARRLGRQPNSHLRGQLTELVRRGLLVHSADGYRLPT